MKDFIECADITDAHSVTYMVGYVFSTDEVGTFLNYPHISLFDYFMDAGTGLRRFVATLLGKNSNFDFRNDSEDGVMNQYLFTSLIEEEVDTSIIERLGYLKDLLIEGANITSYPYIDKTQADLDEAKAIDAIVPVECSYTDGVGYVIKTSREALEFDIQITNGVTDVVFDITIKTCKTSGEQHDPGNFISLLNGEAWSIKMGDRTHVKYQTDATSKKSKLYNRIWLTPNKPCEFAATVKAV